MMVLVKVKELKPAFEGGEINWVSDEKKQLYKNIYNNGFDYDKSVIRITNDKHIIDGNHRAKIIEDIYGGEYEIYVDRWNISRGTYVTLLTLVSIILSPFNKTCREILKVIFKKYK